MGACVTIPNKRSKKAHLQHTNTKNDKFFIQSSFASPTVSNSKHELGVLFEHLTKEKTDFIENLRRASDLSEPPTRIIIEVQKGIDLHRKRCSEIFNPLIRISLEPDGPNFDTQEADFRLPEWYYLVEICQEIRHYDKIKFTVICPDAKKQEFGHTKMRISKLRKQFVVKQWLKVKTKHKTRLRPMICVRIQLISDENELYKQLIEGCNEKIELIQGMLMGDNGAIN